MYISDSQDIIIVLTMEFSQVKRLIDTRFQFKYLRDVALVKNPPSQTPTFRFNLKIA